MNVDDRLRRASSEVRRELAQITPPPRRRPSWVPAAAGATLALALFVGVTLFAFNGTDGEDVAAPPSSPSSSVPADTSVPQVATSTVPPPSTTVPSTVVSAGPPPSSLELTPAAGAFASVTVTGAVASGDHLAAVGCPRQGEQPAGFPAWTIDEDLTLTPAEGPDAVTCLEQIVATPSGLYAQGHGALIRSDEGRRWTLVELPSEVPGAVEHIAVAGDRVTVIEERGALNETSVATLYTTVDGDTWEAIDADVFDTSDVAAILPGGAGLLAVGASPGGEAVPTAAVWTSEDGTAWERLTPSGAGFAGAFMTTVIEVDGRYVAAGADLESGLMAAWTSEDGVAWTRSPAPDDAPHEFGSMVAEALTVGPEGTLYAAGLDFDAALEDDARRPALWASDDGVVWTRIQIQEDLRIPFVGGTAGDRQIDFWPPPFWPADVTVSIVTEP